MRPIAHCDVRRGSSKQGHRLGGDGGLVESNAPNFGMMTPNAAESPGRALGPLTKKSAEYYSTSVNSIPLCTIRHHVNLPFSLELLSFHAKFSAHNPQISVQLCLGLLGLSFEELQLQCHHQRASGILDDYLLRSGSKFGALSLTAPQDDNIRKGQKLGFLRCSRAIYTESIAEVYRDVIVRILIKGNQLYRNHQSMTRNDRFELVSNIASRKFASTRWASFPVGRSFRGLPFERMKKIELDIEAPSPDDPGQLIGSVSLAVVWLQPSEILARGNF